MLYHQVALTVDFYHQLWLNYTLFLVAVERYKSPQLTSKSCILSSISAKSIVWRSTMVCPLSVVGICIGTVLYIQSGSVPGYWMDAHHTENVYFTQKTLEYLQTHPHTSWARWILRDGGNGKVMLESVRYRGYYLDAHHSSYIQVTRSHNPKSDDWTKWTLTKVGDYYYFESVRNAGYYLHNYSGFLRYYAYLLNSQSNPAKMRLHLC